VRRVGGRALALAFTLLAVAAVPASAATYRGAAVGDGAMPVKLKVTGRDLIFEYEQVRVVCSDGSQPRQGGAAHPDRLNARGRFKDRLVVEDPSPGVQMATSVVRGKVGTRRATGTITYEMEYDGGECHSGVVEWKAKRK
jgi:hypothetical protein